jgi:hypothetical protein
VDDLVTQIDALVADVSLRAGDEVIDLIGQLSAERTLKHLV